jgi:hypothetical protein
MRRYFMHMTNQTFEEIGEGLVRVTNPDGKTGVFTWEGRWIEGDVRDVNVNMLIYTGGPDVERGFDFRWTRMPQALDRPSGWPEAQERRLKALGLID